MTFKKIHLKVTYNNFTATTQTIVYNLLLLMSLIFFSAYIYMTYTELSMVLSDKYSFLYHNLLGDCDF